MKVLLTGGTGFVGSWVVRRFLERQWNVAVLARSGSDLWRIEDILSSIDFIIADLGEIAVAADAIHAFGPDVAVHLAWAGVGSEQRDDPGQLRNVTYSLDLLDAAHSAGAKAWIGLGSQAEYGIRDAAITETTPARPVTMYGIAKLATCLSAQRLCQLRNVRFAWARLFAAYGPKDSPASLVSRVTASLIRGECPALTAGDQFWDYVFVGDAAEAIFRLAASPQATGVFNVGSGKVQSIRDTVIQIRDLVDPGLPLCFGKLQYGREQIMHLEADVSRLRETTGWSPQTTMEDGLHTTVTWQRQRQMSARRHAT